MLLSVPHEADSPRKAGVEWCILAIAVLFVSAVCWLASVLTKMLPKRTQNEVAENNSCLFSQIYRPTDVGWAWLDGPALWDDCLGLSCTDTCEKLCLWWWQKHRRAVPWNLQACFKLLLASCVLTSYWPKHVTRPSPASAEWGSTLLPLMEVGWVGEDFWTIIHHTVQDL